jgi:Xaa-Pro aminopeptidase
MFPPMARKNQPQDSIPLSEYIDRRRRVLRELKGAAGVVFAGDGAPPLLGKWRPDFNFYYLMGLPAEPGAAVLFNPAADDPKRRCVLFLRPLNAEMERWDGYREQIGSPLKQRTGFETIMRSNTLPMALTAAARKSKRLACLHPFSTYPAAVSPDLSAFRSISERIPGISIEDRTGLLPSMRSVKSSAELKLMRHAIAATAAGYEAALQVIRPGASEAHVARTLEQTYRDHGAEELAYNSIVGSGLRGTVLHYMDNSGPLEAGDLLVIDSGASFRGYAADVTRTYPVSGKFTAEQREAYEVVLASQKASIKAARRGARMHEVDAAAREVIEKAGLGDAFIHGIGHPLGLEVHDVNPDGPLAPGMVITIEPGIYLPEQKMGIRIEDDVLITSRGNENLTAMIAKEAREIGARMNVARAPRPWIFSPNPRAGRPCYNLCTTITV